MTDSLTITSKDGVTLRVGDECFYLQPGATPTWVPEAGYDILEAKVIAIERDEYMILGKQRVKASLELKDGRTARCRSLYILKNNPRRTH